MKQHILPISIILCAIIIWLIALPHMPDKLPTHWGISGEVNGYSSPLLSMIIMVGMLVLIYVLMFALPKIDPKGKQYDLFHRGYFIMMNGLLIMLLAINLMIILYGAGYPIPMGSTGPLIIGVIFVLLGNFLPTVRPNFFVGIRTPWTLSNEKVWRKTHRLGAKLMVSAGIVMMVSIFLPHEWEIVLCTICFVLGLGIPCVYSYWLYKKEASGES